MGADFTLFDRVPVGVLILDDSWTVLFWNACMASWTGIPAAEIQGHPVASYFPRLAEARYRSRIEPVLAGGPPVILSYQLHGDLFPSRASSLINKVRHTTVTALEDEGRPRLLFSVEDRTEAALRLREARVEIERRLKTEEELRKTVAYKDMLTREINHRVKNNLGLIQGIIELESAEEESSRERFQDLSGRIASIASLHDQLYRAADAEGVDLDEYFGSLARTIFDTFLPRGSSARLELALEASSLPVNTTLKLGLVATELLTNTIKYAIKGRAEGLVRLEIARPGGALSMRISDDGPGFPSGDPMPARRGGLGMRIVRILAEELGGEFRIIPGRGGGTILDIPAGAPSLSEG